MTEGILIGITLCTAFTALILILCTMVGLMALAITYYKNNFITVDAETWNTVADAYNEKVEAEGEAEGGIGGFFRECIEEDIEDEDLIQEEQSVYTLTHQGYIKRLPVSEYKAQGRGGKGVRAMSTKEEDFVETVFTASTHDNILFFMNSGRVYAKKGYTIPSASRTAKGTNIVNILPIENGENPEKVSAMIKARGFDEDSFLLFVTKNGTVKRIALSALKNIRANGIRAINLDEGDELITVLSTNGSERIMIATHEGSAVSFMEDEVRQMGRTAVGVRGIKLREGDYVIGAGSSAQGGALLTVTENGYGKKTDLDEYRICKRGGLGVRNYKISEKTGYVVGVKMVDNGDDLLVITDDGTIIRVSVDDIGEKGRATMGVRVMRPAAGAKIICIEKTERVAEEEEPASEENAE